jgi:hypothetical protein
MSVERLSDIVRHLGTRKHLNAVREEDWPDYSSSDQAGFDASRCSIKFLSLVRWECSISILHPGNAEHERSKESTDADDDAITRAGWQYLYARSLYHNSSLVLNEI